MIFSVSKDGIQWTLDFGPDSVTIAVNDLHQNISISSLEIPLAAWQLLLSQRQDFLNNHPERVPITPNEDGTMEMRDEVLSSVGAQDLDTRSYQVSDLEDIEFNCENSQLEMDAVSRPGIGTPFCVGRRGRQGECSSSINTRVCHTHRTSQAAEKSNFWSKNGKCTRLCF